MRKTFIAVLLLCLAAPFLVAGGSSDKDTAEPATASAPASSGMYNESPLLQPRVSSGELPPIEDRLPANPLVLTKKRNDAPDGILDFQNGNYGGTLNLINQHPFNSPVIGFMQIEQLLSRPGYNLGDPLTGNVAESWSENADKSEYTFTIREGLRWSDGELVTTEDAVFAYEDTFMHEEAQSGFFVRNRALKSGTLDDGNWFTLEVVDDRTFKVVFDQPTPGFLDENNKPWMGYERFLAPKHYLKQFHADYVSEEELIKQVKAAGLENKEDWPKMFWNRAGTPFDRWVPELIGCPVLWPWLIKESSPTRAKFERNPFYFKVDSAGTQLPFVDYLVVAKIEDGEAANLKILAGEVDLEDTVTQIDAIPLYKENEQRGGYLTFPMEQPYNRATIFFNYASEDSAWNELVNDVKFRRALALSIDAEEVSETIYYGFASPSTWVPSSYDTDEANRLLDEAGLDKRDSQGWRIGLDGERLQIDLDVQPRFPDKVPVAELLIEYFKDVGIYSTTKVEEQGFYWEQVNANKKKIVIESDECTTLYSFGHVAYFYHQGVPRWRSWLQSNGAEGEEPAQWWLDVYNLGLNMGPGIPFTDKALQDFKDALFEYVPFIPFLDVAKQPVIVNAKLGNVFSEGVSQWLLYAAEQVYYK